MEGKKSYRNLLKNVMLFGIGSFGTKILSFVLVPLYTNELTTAEYGTCDLITTTANLLYPLCTLSIASGVMRFTLDNDGRQSLKIGYYISIIGNIIATFVLVCLSVAGWLPESLSHYWWIIGICFTSSFYQLYQCYIRGIDKAKIMVESGLLSSIIGLTSNVVLLRFLHLGSTGYLVSAILGTVVSCLYMDLRCRISSVVIETIEIEKDYIRRLLAYSIPSIFITIAWWINSSLDKYFVTGLLGVDQNGIYSIAYKIPTILNVFQTIFMQAWAVSAVQEFDRDDSNGFFTNIYTMFSLSMVFICSVIILLNEPLSRILYAAEFYEAWKYVPLLLLSSLFGAMAGYYGSIFSAVKDQRITAYSTVASAAVNAILNAVLIPRFQVTGAAMATAISYFVSWIIRYFFSRKYICLKINTIRSMLMYFLLLSQAVVAMREDHGYLYQIIILLLIVIVKWEDIGRIVHYLTIKIRNREANNNE